ncbi:unnamed protein product [Strongylus vulgaris]|uniref:Uncharacterized protein n=1 Tax=Strongylus vulgaris TaxID=40348 RepID=A0A3P7IQH9_STRVU|nr:unnamed protein product [Strongylus vulgaris]
MELNFLVNINNSGPRKRRRRRGSIPTLWMTLAKGRNAAGRVKTGHLSR